MLCNIFTGNNLYDISQIHNSDLMGKRADQRQVGHALSVPEAPVWEDYRTLSA